LNSATKSFGITNVGPVRANNEDCLLHDDALSLYVVTDGMGGHAAGEVAAHLAVEAIHEFIRSGEPSVRSEPGVSASSNRLRAAIERANDRVHAAAVENPEYSGMGTTVVCALADGPNVSIGHVGDSRLYLLSHGVLTVQTQDDTWAATLLANGAVDVTAIAEHQMRNVLTNVLGAREQTEVHIAERRLQRGDMLLLCTDGVHGVVDDETLCELMSQKAGLEEIARSLIAMSFERGTRDNVTVVVVRYEG
jgi:serine/threonine protein phosphatase PrpC